jgi:regulator of sirC expression with transglutaminase-like and TPR domain
MSAGRVFTHPALARRRFIELAALPDHFLDLGEASLVIAQEHFAGIDVEHYLRQLDTWADVVRERAAGSTDIERLIEEINHILFEEEGFYGDGDDYYDPRGVHLHEVLERHSGLPLSLSILYIEISRRLGVPMTGVALPGRFLVKVSGPWGEILIDPFDDGRVLSTRECQEIIDAMFGGGVRLREHHLRASSNHDVVARLLAHLKTIYLRHHDLEGAAAASDRLLILDDRDPWELRERGGLAMQLHRYEEAISLLQRYLEVSPHADDRRQIRDQIEWLRGWMEQN